MIPLKSKIFLFMLLLAVDTFANDIPIRCRDTATLDVVNLKNQGSSNGCPAMDSAWEDIVTKGSVTEILSYLDEKCHLKYFREFNIITWRLLASPRAEVRLVAHQIQLNSADELMFQLHVPQTPSYLDVLNDSASRPSHYSSNVRTHVLNAIEDTRPDNPLNPLLLKAKLLAPLICVPFETKNCASALKDAIQLSHVSVVNIGQVTMSDQVKSVFIDERFNQGLAMTTLEILNHIKYAQQGHPPTSHLFDDLIKNFRATGLDADTSLEFTFDFFALYGTRGASMDSISGIVTSENQSVMLAAYLISSGIGVLDAFTLSSGHPYSLPAEFTTNCAYGSTYHFWMPAAISWQLTKKHSVKSSWMAAHILGVGYEMFSSTWGREPSVYLTRETKSTENNMTRIEIAMNDAGARFGAEMGKTLKITPANIDERINIFLDSAHDFVPLSFDQATKLYNYNTPGYIMRWWQMFVPNVGLSMEALTP